MPKEIDGHVILRRLDSGGQAVVYEAKQENPPRVVAIKVLRGDRASNFAQDRFWYEAELLGRVSHPGIVKVYSTGTWDPGTGPMPYIVMEYVHGAWPITQYVENAKLPVRERLRMMVRVCDAVQHAHVHGIIHRDIKPGNVLVDAQGHPRLIDFGVARGPKEDFVNRKETQRGQIVGTTVYLAPEQTLGDQGLVDARADVYALGLLLYRLVCGRMPYDVDDVDDDTARRVIREASPVRPSKVRGDVTEDLDAVILTALAKEPEERYQSARELADEIRRLLDGKRPRAKVPGAWHAVRATGRRVIARYRRTCMASAAVVGMFAAILGGPPIVHVLWLEEFFQAGMVRLAHPPRPADMLSHVRVAGLSDATPHEALARDLGLPPIDLADPKTFRPLHGKVMERLAESGARAVVLDLAFREPSPHDGFIAAGLDRLQAAGIDACKARVSWDLRPPPDPSAAPAFDSRVLTGSVMSGLSSLTMWRVELALAPRSGDVLPSLSLVGYASAMHPGRQFRYDLVPGAAEVTVRPGRYESDRTGLWIDEADPLVIRCTNVKRDPGSPELGISRGDLVAEFFFDLPPSPALDETTHDYAELLAAPVERLREWFGGRVVLLADMREASADYHATPDGRTLHGVWTHALAIDAMLGGRAIVMANWWQQWAAMLVAAMLGLSLAIWAPWAIWRRLLVIIILTGAAIGGSVMLFSTWGVLLNPVLAIGSAAAAGELSAWIRRVRAPLG